MHINYESHEWVWLTTTFGGACTWIFLCLALPILGGFMNPAEIMKQAIFRSIILTLWDQDARICAIRHMLESHGVITEPVVGEEGACLSCKKGIAMSLECDMTRQRIHFRGMILRCANCGNTVDNTPGPTLFELTQKYIVQYTYQNSISILHRKKTEI